MSLKNIYSVGSIFIASVTVDVFKMDREKCLVVTANCYPSYQPGRYYFNTQCINIMWHPLGNPMISTGNSIKNHTNCMDLA
jgi:hypothetical protein